MIKRADKLEKEFFSFVTMLAKKMSAYDDRLYSLDYILEHRDATKYYVVCSHNHIMDIIGSGKEYGKKVLYPFFLTGGENGMSNTLENIKKYFKKDVLLDIEYINYEKYGLYPTNLESSMREGYHYRIHGSYFVLNENEVNVIRDSIERTYFPRLKDVSEIEFELVEGDKVSKYLYNDAIHDYPLWEERYGHAAYLGFHYLAIDCYEQHKLLVAKYKGALVGAVKIGAYYLDTPNYKHYGLNYIDVNYRYRRMGIAKMLIHELTKYIPSDMPLVLSSESEMGRTCRMEAHFKAEQGWQTKLYTSKEWEEYQWSLIK